MNPRKLGCKAALLNQHTTLPHEHDYPAEESIQKTIHFIFLRSSSTAVSYTKVTKVLIRKAKTRIFSS